MISGAKLRAMRSVSVWPGYVDALSAILMVVIFVLLIFAVVHFLLSEILSGQESELKLLLEAHYPPLIREGLPTIHYRIGLQAVKEEDRRILDYSELITSLGEGAGRKFIDLISSYVDGNVKSTVDEVQDKYKENYPRKSAERLVPARLTIPLSLNETQRKIILWTSISSRG